MQLLDAIIAFALTLAALATVVTVIMEAGLRIARMRKKNFIEVMKLLNKELDNGPLSKNGALGMSDDQRWDFLVRVVNNPAEAAFDEIKAEIEALPLESRLDYWGKDSATDAGWFKRILNFITNIRGDKKRACLYEGVSMEYLLRCLVDTPSVKQASRKASDTLKVEFNRLARRYEEFGSSVSASFKHHSQGWSIGIGILLALCANIDGVRIFQAYRADANLSAAVIEKQEKFLNQYEQAQAKLDTLIEEGAQVDDGDIEAINTAIEGARGQIADLSALGVPMGWDLYPVCPYGEADKRWAFSSPQCKAISAESRNNYKFEWDDKVLFEVEQKFLNVVLHDKLGFIAWIFSLLITGILIGLGAPFWFDVAKRLSAVRKGLQSPTASSEYRLSGKNADGDPDRRNEIVNKTVDQAQAEANLMSADTGGRRRAFFDLKGGHHGRII